MATSTASVRCTSAALVLWLCFMCSKALGDGRPNILFIVIDDLRPSLGCYGGPIISPNIDQLAAQSAVFTNAMVQQSLCAPSRTSFLTGRRPDTTKLYDFYSYWRKAAGNYTTIPQHFKENGYFTASVGKVFHPGVASGNSDDYPYSWSVPAYHPSTEQYIKAKVCPNLDETLHDNVMCPVNVDEMPEKTLPDLQAFDRAAEILQNLSIASLHKQSEFSSTNDFNNNSYINDNDDVIEIVKQTRVSSIRGNSLADGSGTYITTSFESTDLDEHMIRKSMKPPFFLGVGYRKPHIPWKYPKAYQALYPIESVEIASNPNIPDKLPSVAYDDYHSMRLREDIRALNLSFPYGTIPLDYHAPMRQNYYASSTYTDHQVGRLLHVLEQSGFANNTIILFVGDHGWQLGEHSEWCKFSNYELATRVPLLVHVPGVTDIQWSSSTKFAPIDPLEMNIRNRESQEGNRVDTEIINYKNTDRQELIHKERVAYRLLKDKSTVESYPKPLTGIKIDELVELVDIFPSLSELAGLTIPPICPPASFNVDFCAEGVSFAPLVAKHSVDHVDDNASGGSRLHNFVRWKNATFSQYPRPSVTPGKITDVPHLANITIMGYSMRTVDFHYTEWIGFNHTSFAGNWTDVKAKELYINASDPDQNDNVADNEQYKNLVRKLSAQLKRGWRDCLPVHRDA